jgi:hypothetical protein
LLFQERNYCKGTYKIIFDFPIWLNCPRGLARRPVVWLKREYKHVGTALAAARDPKLTQFQHVDPPLAALVIGHEGLGAFGAA